MNAHLHLAERIGAALTNLLEGYGARVVRPHRDSEFVLRANPTGEHVDQIISYVEYEGKLVKITMEESNDVD